MAINRGYLQAIAQQLPKEARQEYVSIINRFLFAQKIKSALLVQKIFKDLEPAKDTLSEITEEEPKSIEEMKRRLSKKIGKK